MAEVNQTDHTKTVAVTGATGLLGGYLVEHLLREGYTDVVVLLRKESTEAKLFSFLEYRGISREMFSRLKIARFNMSNPHEWTRNLQGVNTLYHCAAVVAIGGIDPQEIISANRDLSQRVADGCLSAGVDLLVYVSSIATLGGARHVDAMVDETMPLDNFADCSAYTVSKFFAENQVRRAQIFGLKTIIVHPGIILGSSNVDNAGSASIAAQAIKMGYFYTEGVIGYVDVRDVARAMVMLSARPEAVSRNYLLCSDNISYRHLITTIRRGAGRRAPLFGMSYKNLLKVAFVDKLFSKIKGRRPVVTRDIARNMSRKLYYDGSLITREHDFEYTPIDTTLEYIAKEYVSLKHKR